MKNSVALAKNLRFFWTVLNTGVSSDSKKFRISVIKISCVDLAAAKHEGSVDNEYLLVDEGKMVNGSFCSLGKYVRSAMLSNQESSSDSTSSPSANVLLIMHLVLCGDQQDMY